MYNDYGNFSVKFKKKKKSGDKVRSVSYFHRRIIAPPPPRVSAAVIGGKYGTRYYFLYGDCKQKTILNAVR